MQKRMIDTLGVRARSIWSVMTLGLLALSPLCAAVSLPGAPQDGWVSYEVALQPGQSAPCCQHISGKGSQVVTTGCDLDQGEHLQAVTFDPEQSSGGAERLRVYLRMQDGKLSGLHALGSACPVRTASPVLPLASVSSAASLAWLSAQATEAPESLREAAVMSIAFHAGAAADKALIAATAPDRDDGQRRSAVFWLGQVRGVAGVDAVARLARQDLSVSLRKHAVFALSQSKDPRVVPTLSAIARDDASAAVRGETLFWMAQVFPGEARRQILASLRRDEEAAVHEQAVFALSQLKDGADDALIELLEGNYPRPVKKQAMFWLAQSGSERALGFLDRTLGGGS